MLQRSELGFPGGDYFGHLWGRRGEDGGVLWLGAVFVQGGVVLREEGVLYEDLCGEEVRDDGESGVDDGREHPFEIVVGRRVLL